MFLSRKNEKHPLDDEIQKVKDRLSTLDISFDEEEYHKTLVTLEKLIDLRREDPRDRISADTKATVAANLLGILMILNFERFAVVTSKAVSFVVKTKL